MPVSAHAEMYASESFVLRASDVRSWGNEMQEHGIDYGWHITLTDEWGNLYSRFYANKDQAFCLSNFITLVYDDGACLIQKIESVRIYAAD